MRTIQLNAEKKIITVVEQSVICSSVDVLNVVDNGSSVVVNINANGFQKTLVLWEGQSYNDIGQWTDDDVNKRILELL